MPEKRRLPNPGSDLARELGCICAVLDNNHGIDPPYPPDGWWVTEDCPVHKPEVFTGDGDTVHGEHPSGKGERRGQE